ncbi:MAG: two-component sensor histidine kinase [Mariprofundaceae bacterium]|nr:two-component sensor histidine kinase [Mariprofundaceae bacterium]
MMQTDSLPANEQEKWPRLTRLLYFRTIASLAVLTAAIYFFYEPSPLLQRRLLLGASGCFFLFIAFEWYLTTSSVSFFKQLLIQFGLDLLLIGVLVVMTGGIQSPFVFLFGLVIVAAGTQSHVMAVLLTTIFACICYLSSVYGFSTWHQLEITAAETLHILLQVSALFLVGGAMAAIARRHASLQQESHQVVRQHRRLKELHEQIVTSMQEGMLILDQALYIQDSNESARRLLLLAGSNPAWLKLEEVAELPAVLGQFLKNPDRELFQCEWNMPTGTCLVTATQLPGSDPTAQWLLTLVDITDIRHLEKRLAEQDKLAAMGKMIAMLAHEVRNPMQTIAQSVEIMKSVKKPQQEKIQKIVSEEVGRLNRLVSDLLDYVHPLSPVLIKTSPSEVIGSSVAQVDLKNEHRISWSSAIDSLMLDPDHLRLVLDNLLRNALQASKQPGTIVVNMEGRDGDWELSVSDQGGGISEAVKDRLFEPFATGRPGGIGLGLATVWQVCQVNGWQVAVEPIAGGSRFIIRGELLSSGARGK